MEMNYYLKQIDGNLFVICEKEKPERENYIVNGNNALVSEDYFLDLKDWENARKIYECHSSQAGEFLKLASAKEGYSLSDLNEDLQDGILIPSERVEIKKINSLSNQANAFDDTEYAFVVEKN